MTVLQECNAKPVQHSLSAHLQQEYVRVGRHWNWATNRWYCPVSEWGNILSVTSMFVSLKRSQWEKFSQYYCIPSQLRLFPKPLPSLCKTAASPIYWATSLIQSKFLLKEVSCRTPWPDTALWTASLAQLDVLDMQRFKGYSSVFGL